LLLRSFIYHTPPEIDNHGFHAIYYPEYYMKGGLISMKVVPEYRGLSRKEILDKAYEKGVNYEMYSMSCSQCTVAALHDILGFEDVIVKVANSSSGCQASHFVGTCGGLVGGTMVLDYFFGRPYETLSDKEFSQERWEALMKATQIPKLLYFRSINEYGTTICPSLQVKLYGRVFYFADEDDRRKFEEAGGHADPRKTGKISCCHLVGNAAKWTLEILLDKGVVEL
jgi:hypothetical protein